MKGQLKFNEKDGVWNEWKLFNNCLKHYLILIFTLQLVETNLDFTNTPHTPLKRDGVLFLTQRRQATSDIRENPKV